MGKIPVTKKFLEEVELLANDLYGLADINGDKENKRKLKAFIKKVDRYLQNIEQN